MDGPYSGHARQLAAMLGGGRASRPDRRQQLALQLLGTTQRQADGHVAQATNFDPAVRAWRNDFQARFGEAPNMADPGFNYGLAFAGGARPERYEHDGGARHWPSSVPVAPMGDVSLKSDDHPTAWMEGFMQRTGVDPHEADYPTTLREYLAGNIPLNWRR